MQLRASIYDNNGNAVLRSSIQNISISQNSFEIISSTNIDLNGLHVSDTYRAGDHQGIYFRFVESDGSVELPTTYSLTVTDADTGASVFSESNVILDDESGYHFHFDRHKSLLTQTGNYVFSFSDSSGQTVHSKVRIVADFPNRLVVVAPDVLLQGMDMSAVIRLYDQYDNPASGYDGSFSIQGSDDMSIEVIGIDSTGSGNGSQYNTYHSVVPFTMRPENTNNQNIRISYSLD